MRVLSYILLLFPEILLSQHVSVSIWNSQPVKGLTLSLYNGGYDFYSDNQRISGFDEGKVFYITLYNNSLLLSNTSGSIGIFDDLFITSQTDSSRVQITSIDPKLPARVYSDNIHLKIEYGRILILNEVNNEKYIAGVVEAEAGINAFPEFYKAQSLLCRTYLYDHLSRHETEGFNLCDEVHCQAYKGVSPFTRFIFQSTVQTRNKVITDSNNQLITASFHANCGGQTESSLNTWLKKEDYLVPVKDVYCHKSANANWEKKISVAEWRKYLIGHGVKAQSAPVSSLEMKKTTRQTYYKVSKDSILTRQIRADWNLKSSFFQVIARGNSIVIKGHGYGHGVGLCQDGAMKMAESGFNYPAIINFYFKNVKVSEYKPLL